MKALVFNTGLSLRDVALPARRPGEALVRVIAAGICNTDIEITRGYIPGYSGIPGHEFIGVVEEADSPALVGRRVTAEINCGCSVCESCRSGMERHCPARTVLGIVNRDGVFAEFVRIPEKNIVSVPSAIPDDRALFIEPLAAALEILEQVRITSDRRVLLIGDGKLAILIALALKPTGCCLTVVGKHDDRLARFNRFGIGTTLRLDRFTPAPYDIVIEASGNPSGFELGLACVKPRGIFILKSTYAAPLQFNPAPVVVNEITLIGSRCGRFGDAIAFLLSSGAPLEELITHSFPLEKGVEAFAKATMPGTMKVVLRTSLL